MNIILCVIDTLRYDYIRAHGANDWIETPNLDRLAEASLVFDRAYAASYPTIPHRTDVMTGEYAWPYKGPFHPWMPLRFDVPTLPRLLAQAGYATQLIHDTPHLVNGGHAFDWPFAAWRFVRGAEVDRPWIDDAALAPLENWERDPLFDYIDAESLTGGTRRMALTYARANRRRKRPEDWNAAQVFLGGTEFVRDNAHRGRTSGSRRRRRRGAGGADGFFLWLDCFDPHEPWDVPPDFVKRYDKTPAYEGRIDPRSFLRQVRNPADGVFPPGVRERLTAFYAAKVSWVDHWFGQLLDALEETGLADCTAIVLTADHGTNLGERGGFGKTGIVNEQEAHVPLLVHVPDGPTGRCSAIVQPQDISATILALAGVACPEAWVGHDLVDVARRGGDGPRELALSGPAAVGWRGDPSQVVFTVFDQTWYLNVAAAPEACRLYKYGSVDNVAAAHAEVVAHLHDAALSEAERRGTEHRLIAWLRSAGSELFPSECTRWFGPDQWRTYWERVYQETRSADA